jgi:D-arabinose 1-dehydrogenase-like Zn-dependent alcohol dehydrogenase
MSAVSATACTSWPCACRLASSEQANTPPRVCGARAGRAAESAAPHALHRLIFGELRLVGSAMGTAEELAELLAFLDRTGLRPRIARELPSHKAAEGFRAMPAGETDGKIVFTRDG